MINGGTLEKLASNAPAVLEVPPLPVGSI